MTRAVNPPLRQHRRYDLELEVQVACDSWQSFVQMFTKDISQGGVFVKTAEPLPLQSQARICFNVLGLDKTLALHGEVVHLITPALAEDSGLDSGMGIRFVELTPAVHQALKRLTESSARAKAAAARRLTGAVQSQIRWGELLDAPAASPIEAALANLDPDDVDLIAALTVELQRLQGLDLHARLGVEPSASAGEIDAAFRTRIDRFQPARFERFRGREVQELASQIFDLLVEARDQLRGTMRREATSDAEALGLEPPPAFQVPDLPDPAQIYRRGLEALESGAYDRAKALFAAAVGAEPDNTTFLAALHAAIGYAYKAARNPELAYTHFRNACDLDDGCVHAVREVRALGGHRAA